MIKIILILLALFNLVGATVPVVVNTAKAYFEWLSGQSSYPSGNMAMTGGNSVVVACHLDAGAEFTGVGDGVNTYTLIDSTRYLGNRIFAVYRADDITAGTRAVSINLQSSTYIYGSIVAVQYSDLGDRVTGISSKPTDGTDFGTTISGGGTVDEDSSFMLMFVFAEAVYDDYGGTILIDSTKLFGVGGRQVNSTGASRCTLTIASAASLKASIAAFNVAASECSTPTGTNPSNRIDTIGQAGKFALVHDGCEPDSFHILNFNGIDSAALVATKDSVAYHCKKKQLTAVSCSLSLWYGGAAVDTVAWTWRTTGPSAGFTATRDTLTVGLLDSTHQTIPDSLTDSVTCASPPAGLAIFKTGANMGDFYGTLEHLTTYYPLCHWWRGGIAADSARDTIVASEIPLIDSIRPNPQWRSDSASMYGTGFLAGGVLRNITVVPAADVIQKDWASNGTKIDYYIPPTWPRGWNRLVVTNSDSLRDTLSQYIAIIRKK